MPELPEVEAARKAVHESCCGRRIIQAKVADDSIVIEGVVPSALETALVGRTIVAARRKGKNVWLELDSRPWPSFQFGMTGAFYIKGKEITKYKRSAVSDEEEWPSKFSKVFLKLDDGLEVSFTDKRRLARVRLFNDPLTTPPISELGPDAFLELPAEDTFMSLILKKRCPIKALLLDQSFVAGIGNWVADEVLYQARIHPEQVASSLSEAECLELHKTIQMVLKFAVEVDADSEKFPEDWIFHYRWNKKPGEVGGQKISFITVGGRTSAVVSTLQICTVYSARKNVSLAQVHVEEVGLENTSTKKKRGRKQPPTALGVEEEEGLNEKRSEKKSKRSSAQVDGSRKAAGSKKSAGTGEKPTLKPDAPTRNGRESKKEVVSNDRKAKASESMKEEEDAAAALPKSVRKGRKGKQEDATGGGGAVTKRTAAVTQKDKVGKKTSTEKKATKVTIMKMAEKKAEVAEKATKITIMKMAEEKAEAAVEDELSDMPTKKQYQRRRRAAK